MNSFTSWTATDHVETLPLFPYDTKKCCVTSGLCIDMFAFAGHMGRFCESSYFIFCFSDLIPCCPDSHFSCNMVSSTVTDYWCNGLL